MRADKGGHSAPEPVLRNIYEASLRNLPRAIHELDASQSMTIALGDHTQNCIARRKRSRHLPSSRNF